MSTQTEKKEEKEKWFFEQIIRITDSEVNSKGIVSYFQIVKLAEKTAEIFISETLKLEEGKIYFQARESRFVLKTDIKRGDLLCIKLKVVRTNMFVFELFFEFVANNKICANGTMVFVCNEDFNTTRIPFEISKLLYDLLSCS